MHMHVKHWKLAASIQISTASLSFISSSVTAVIIARSRTNNGKSPLKSSPYHRIIFGLSISDILQSFAMITGPFAAPSSVPQALWGAGNSQTCRANGFLLVLGTVATPMYIFMLCLYCLSNTKKTALSQDGFPKKLEWAMHIFIFAFNLFFSVIGLITKSINTIIFGTVCGFAEYPTGCSQRPDIVGECDEAIARYAKVCIYSSWIGVSFVCLVGIVMSMSMMCWYVARTNRIFEGSKQQNAAAIPLSQRRTAKKTTRASAVISKDSGSSSDSDIHGEDFLAIGDLPSCQVVTVTPHLVSSRRAEGDIDHTFLEHGQKVVGRRSNTCEENSCNEVFCKTIAGTKERASNFDEEMKPDAQEPSERKNCNAPTIETKKAPSDKVHSEVLLRTYSREIMFQAFLFVLAFIGTYIFLWTTLVFRVTMKKDPPLLLTLGIVFFYPLGGVFNILVYTRPKINSFLRQERGQYSWLRAFFLVVKAGCVVPTVTPPNYDQDVSQEGIAAPLGCHFSKVKASSQRYLKSSDIAGDYGYSQSFDSNNKAREGQENKWSWDLGGESSHFELPARIQEHGGDHE